MRNVTLRRNGERLSVITRLSRYRYRYRYIILAIAVDDTCANTWKFFLSLSLVTQCYGKSFLSS